MTTLAPAVTASEANSKFTIYGRKFEVFYDKHLKHWTAVEYNSERDIIWYEYANTRDSALIYIGMESERSVA